MLSHNAAPRFELLLDTRMCELSFTKIHQWCKKARAIMRSDYRILTAECCTLVCHMKRPQGFDDIQLLVTILALIKVR